MSPRTKIWQNLRFFSGSDPPNGYISSSYDHWGGNQSKKDIKNFDDVQILWNDPYIVFINLFPLQNAAQNCRKRANDRLSDLTEDVHEKKRKKEECVAELERVKRIYEDELSRYFKIER